MEEKAVKGKDVVKVEYTKEARFHKPGEVSEVHKLQAEKLVSKGFAKIVK